MACRYSYVLGARPAIVVLDKSECYPLVFEVHELVVDQSPGAGSPHHHSGCRDASQHEGRVVQAWETVIVDFESEDQGHRNITLLPLVGHDHRERQAPKGVCFRSLSNNARRALDPISPNYSQVA